MTEEQEERLVTSFEMMATALEMMATALVSMGKTYELLYYKMYPPGRPPRDLVVSRPPTEEEKLRADLGETGEPTTEDWMKLDAEQEMGPRERRFVEREERRRQENAGAEEGSRGPEGGPQKAGT